MQKTPISLRILLGFSWLWFAAVALVATAVILPGIIGSNDTYISYITAIFLLLVLLQFFAAFSLQKRKSFAPMVALAAAVVFVTILLMAKIVISVVGVLLNIAIVVLVLINWKHFLLAKGRA